MSSFFKRVYEDGTVEYKDINRFVGCYESSKCTYHSGLIDKILHEIKGRDLKEVGILITHSHFDHVGAVEVISNAFPEAVMVTNKNKGEVSIGLFKFKIIKIYPLTEYIGNKNQTIITQSAESIMLYLID